MLNSISVGVDESTTSIDALIWADQLSSATGATLRAIHVWDTPQPRLLGPRFSALPSAQSRENAGREVLSGALATSNIGGEPEPVLLQGAAGRVLVDESEADDLLVLGRTGWGCRRLAQIVLGSTARYVTNNARVAVAVVPQHAHWLDAPRVFVGIDGSASSCEALRWAVANLPEASDIHAVWALPYWSETLKSDDMELFHHASEAVLVELETCISVATDHDASLSERVRAHVEPGSPRRVFTRTETEMDIVIVAKHGTSGAAAPIVGSVADHIVRYAPCPVIVVPA